MPITIDITQDVRFNAGIEIGEEKGKAKGKLEGKFEGKTEAAENMIIKGFPLLLVQETTGLEMDFLIGISNKITKEK